MCGKYVLVGIGLKKVVLVSDCNKILVGLDEYLWGLDLVIKEVCYNK